MSENIFENIVKSIQGNETKTRTLVVECPTRWNATHDMIRRFLLLKESIKVYCNLNATTNKNTNDFSFSDTDCDTLQQTETMFENAATTKMYASKSYRTTDEVLAAYPTLSDLFAE